MKEYYNYINGALSGKIIVPKTIRQAIERIEKFKQSDDMYFDEEEVQRCFDFISLMKEWQGASAGMSASLLPFQKFIVATFLGLKWKKTDTRVAKEIFLLVGRKNAKTSLLAKLSAYFMICDGEEAPYIGCFATSAQNARILFEAACNYLKTIDANSKYLRIYRNYIKFPKNNGEFHVFSSDSKNKDGYSFSTLFYDEVHSYRDNSLIAVGRSSQGARKQPSLWQITTAGFLLDGYPCYETWKMSLEILNGIKEDRTFFPFIYQFDSEDEIEDEDMWIKANPAIDVVIDRQYLREQKLLAENNPSEAVGVKTKNFNIWCNASSVWIPNTRVAECMQSLDINDFRGFQAYMGVDLSSTNDITALSVMIPKDEKKYFFTYAFLPEETYRTSCNAKLYERFRMDGELFVTPGNVVDYQYIINKIKELNDILKVEAIYYDKWNSTQFAITCTEIGLPMVQQAQGLLAFSAPTKEFERIILTRNAVINKSAMFLWQMGNVVLATDHNNNVKPSKSTHSNKIDNVISSIQALSGYLANPVNNDFDIFVF